MRFTIRWRSFIYAVLSVFASLATFAQEARIQVLSVSATAGIQLELTGEVGATGLIEFSRDLATWRPIHTNVMVNGQLRFTHPPAGGDCGYYRGQVTPTPERTEISAILSDPMEADGMHLRVEDTESPAEPTVRASQTGWRPAQALPNTTDRWYMYYVVDDVGFVHGGAPSLKLTVTFYDEAPGTLRVVYDSSDPTVLVSTENPGAWKEAGNITLAGTGTWQTRSLLIKDARFSHRCNGADLRFEISATAAPTIRSVVLTRGNFAAQWRVMPTSMPTPEPILAGVNIRDFGASGNGVTDDTEAFRIALLAMSLDGGGTVFVPAGRYVLRGSLEVPVGVMLRGEWERPGMGPIRGSILAVYAGRGNEDGPPAILLNESSGLMDMAIWYPEQDASAPVPYPFAVKQKGGDSATVQEVTLVNAWRGVAIGPEGNELHLVRDLYGTVLKLGLSLDLTTDIGRLENLNLGPDYWPASRLPGAPAAGGPHAAFMRTQGTGMRLYRSDWQYAAFISIRGYAVGLEMLAGSQGSGNGQFYGLNIQDCDTALSVAEVNPDGYVFTRSRFSGNSVGVRSGGTFSGALLFHSCTLSGGTSAATLDGTADSAVLLQSCTTEGPVRRTAGYLGMMDCRFSSPREHLDLGTNVQVFTAAGNSFAQTPSVLHPRDFRIVSGLIETNPRPSTIPTFSPPTRPTNSVSARLFVVTDAAFGAQRNASADATAAIAAALQAAADAGGGMVFLPAGEYLLNGRLAIPSGVELRGVYEVPHHTTGKGSVIRVLAGRGEADAPPTLTVAANAAVRGLTFIYPDQRAEAIVPYPTLIQGRGADIRLLNLTAMNPYRFIDLATYRCDRHFLNYVAGAPLAEGIRAGGGSRNGVVLDTQFNPHYWTRSPFADNRPALLPDGGQSVWTYQLAHLDAFVFGDWSGVQQGNFVFGSRVGLRLIEENGRGPSGVALGHGTDGSPVAVSAEGTATEGFDFINSQLVSMATGDRAYIQVSGAAKVRFYGSLLWGQPELSVHQTGGQLEMELANFAAYGPFDLKGGSFLLANAYLRQRLGTGTDLALNGGNASTRGVLSAGDLTVNGKPYQSFADASLTNPPIPERTEISVLLNDPAQNDGLHLRVEDVESRAEPTVRSGQTGWRPVQALPDTSDFWYMYYVVDDTQFVDGGAPSLRLTVTFYDEAPGTLRVVYDSSDPTVLVSTENPGAWKEAGSITLTGTGTWQTRSLLIKDARFNHRCNGADLRLEIRATAAPTIRSVVLTRGSFAAQWRVMPTTLPTPEPILAGVNVRDFGASGNGATDDTDAFRTALLAMSLDGGGTVFVPAGRYVLRGSLEVPVGVTLRGEWERPGTGPVRGSILAAYADRGNEDGPPAILLSESSGLMDMAIWYPEQDATAPVPYPFAIKQKSGNSATVRQVTLVNAWRGVSIGPEYNILHLVRDLYGTALKLGLSLDMTTDIGRLENVNFGPDYWSASGLPGAPAAGGPHAAFMRTQGTGMRLYRSDWQYAAFLSIRGYATGLELLEGAQGSGNGQFYGLDIQDCDTALSVAEVNPDGYVFTQSRFSGSSVGVRSGGVFSGALLFHSCTLSGGTSAATLDGTADSAVLLQSCTTEGPVRRTAGYLGLMDCRFSSPREHLDLETNVQVFTAAGNSFAQTPSILRPGKFPFLTGVIETNPRPSTIPTFRPLTPPTNSVPARLFVVTDAPFGAQRNASADASAAIAAALQAAADAGGGTVFLPAGEYLLSGRLAVPSGVELRGVSEVPHHTTGKGSVVRVVAGRGEVDAPPTITVAANASLRGLTFMYPDQRAEAVVPYPTLIQGRGADIRLLNLTAMNPYRFIDLATYRCDRHFLDYVAGAPLTEGIRAGGGSRNGVILDTQFNPHYWTFSPFADNRPAPSADGGSSVWAYQLAHLDAFVFGDWSGVQQGNFVFGSRVGLRLIEENGRGPSGVALGHGTDGSPVAVSAEGTAAEGFDFINSQLVSMTTGDRAYIQVSGTAKVRFYGSLLWGQPELSVRQTGGQLEMELANFAEYGPFDLKGGSFLLANAYLRQRLGTGADIALDGGSGATRGVVSSADLVVNGKPYEGFANASLTTPSIPERTAISVILSNPAQSDGLHLRVQDGESRAEPVERAGQTGYRPVQTLPGLSDSWYMYYVVDEPAFANGGAPSLKLTVTFYDEGSGTLRVVYDSSDPTVLVSTQNPGAWKEAGMITLTGTGTWQTRSLLIKDAQFSHRCNGGDLRFEIRATAAPTIRSVALTRGSFAAQWRVMTTTLPTAEPVLAGVNVRDFGARGDGATDDTEAFRTALLAMSLDGGGTVFAPAGRYVLRGALEVPAGVTLRGEWERPGAAALRGSVLAVYADRGNENGPPAILLNESSGLMDMAIWYPEQDAAAPAPYPFAIKQRWGDSATVQEVTLVNAWRGVAIGPEGNELHLVRDLYGTALKLGLSLDMTTDIGRLENVNLGPDYWSVSGLPGAPAAGGPHAAFMRTQGTGMRFYRSDWQYAAFISIRGYAVGLEMLAGSQGSGNGQFYGLDIQDCDTALWVAEVNPDGYVFTRSRFSGSSVGVRASSAFYGALLFHSCTLSGGSSAAELDGTTDSAVLFQSCNTEGPVRRTAGYLGMLDCQFSSSREHLELGADVQVFAAAGNSFAQTPSFLRPKGYPLVASLIETNRRPSTIPAYSPVTRPTNSVPARLFVVTDASFGAARNASADATAAIAAALRAAAEAGGGIVLLPAGEYLLGGRLAVPSGVELRGVYEVPHHTSGKGSVIRVLAGRGEGEAAPTITVAANASLRGLTFMYPDQRAEAIVPYPTLIQGQGADIRLVNLTAMNPYRFIDLATYRCDRHFLDYVAGSPLAEGIRAGGGSRDGVVLDTQFNPHYWVRSPFADNRPTFQPDGSNDVWTYQLAHLDAFVFGDWSGVQQGNFVFGSRVGLRLVEENGRGPRGIALGHGTDGSPIAVSVEGTAAEGFDFINAQLVSMTQGQREFIRMAGTAKARFYGSILWGQPDLSVRQTGGQLEMELANFVEYGAFDLKGGSCLLANAYMRWRKGTGADLAIDGGNATTRGVVSAADLVVKGKPYQSAANASLTTPSILERTEISVVLNNPVQTDGLHLRVEDVESRAEPVDRAGQTGWRPALAIPNLTDSWYMYYVVDAPEFVNGGAPSLKLSVTFFDEGAGTLRVVYDSSDPTVLLSTENPGAWKEAGYITLSGTGTWQTRSLLIKDARFSHRCNGGDLRFEIHATAAPTIRSVVLTRGSFAAQWRLMPTTLPTAEPVLAAVNVRDFGATGDGVTDDTEAMRMAMLVMSQDGGGTVFVPAGRYVLRGSLEVPTGVTLRGEWERPGTSPMRGSILAVYADRGNEDGPPAILLGESSGLVDMAIWYPEQDAAAPVPYPFAIKQKNSNSATVQEVTLVNAWRGLSIGPDYNILHLVRDVYGTVLKLGLSLDMTTDIGRLENVNYGPDFWSASGLPGAPAAGGPHATFMRTQGTGMRLYRSDWQYAAFISIRGYAVGLEMLAGAQGSGNGQFYGLDIQDCDTALSVAEVNRDGYVFTRSHFSGSSVGVRADGAFDGALLFHSCTLSGGTRAAALDGTAASAVLFQSCSTEGPVRRTAGYLGMLDCRFSSSREHLDLGTNVQVFTATGNSFAQAPSILRPSGFPIDSTLIEANPRPSTIPTFNPVTQPTNSVAARLFVVTEAPFGAARNASADATAAIAAALQAAADAGGGTVFLPAGEYLLNGRLAVPSGVELRGVGEVHSHTMGRGSVIRVLGGRGEAEGAPTITVAANASLRGLMFIHPDQRAEAIVPYPTLIQGQGADIRLVNLTAMNPYRFIDLATHRCDRHFLDYVAGSPLAEGIRAGGGSRDGVILDTQFNPHYWTFSPFADNRPAPSADGGSSVWTYQLAHLDAFVFGDWSGVQQGNFVFGSRVGLRLIEENGRGPSGVALGHGTDGSPVAVSAEGTVVEGFDLINAQLVSMATSDRAYIQVSGAAKVRFYGSLLWGHPELSVRQTGGQLEMELANFAEYGSFSMKGGSFQLANAYLRQRLGTGADIAIDGGNASTRGVLSSGGLLVQGKPYQSFADASLTLPPIPGASEISVVLTARQRSDGIALRESDGESDNRPTEALGIPGWVGTRSVIPDQPLYYMYFDVTHPEFTQGAVPKIEIEVQYFDQAGGWGRVVYDSSDPTVLVSTENPGAWKEAGRLPLQGDGAWHTVVLQVTDAYFANRCNGADLRLEIGAGPPPVIGKIAVRKK